MRRMRETCSKYGSTLTSPRRLGGNHTLMWDLHHHLVYCPIYKVASGTWTTNFLRLSNFNSDLPRWQRFSKLHNASESVARSLFPPPRGRKQQRAALAVSTKFLVVRHPFDRILSAYTGKIANPLAKVELRNHIRIISDLICPMSYKVRQLPRPANDLFMWLSLAHAISTATYIRD